MKKLNWGLLSTAQINSALINPVRESLITAEDSQLGGGRQPFTIEGISLCKRMEHPQSIWKLRSALRGSRH